MSFNAPAQAFPPPAPPARKSRSGGLILIVAGIVAAVSPFITWVPEGKTTLQDLVDLFAGNSIAGDVKLFDNPQTWFYAILGGAGAAILFGLIGMAAGGSGANVTAGIFGLFAAAAIAYPTVWIMTAANSASDLSQDLGNFGPGFYASAGAGLLALIGMLFAFIGATKK